MTDIAVFLGILVVQFIKGIAIIIIVLLWDFYNRFAF